MSENTIDELVTLLAKLPGYGSVLVAFLQHAPHSKRGLRSLMWQPVRNDLAQAVGVPLFNHASITQCAAPLWWGAAGSAH